MFAHRSFAFAFALLLAACKKTAPPPAPAPAELTVMPRLEAAPTTRERTLAARPRGRSEDNADPISPRVLADDLVRGMGDLTPGPGEEYVTRTLDGRPPPKPGPNARRLLRFAHVTDLQLADDESPARLAGYDGASPTASGAARPQDAYLCRLTNAAVRTLNALSRKDPIAFTLLGGDNLDSAQENELGWLLAILGGAPRVACDSGAKDDPIPGPDNDGKDPFLAEGFAMPWKWVTGNHDVLVQGVFPVDAKSRAVALGRESLGGTRAYADGGSVDRGAFVVPDPQRTLLSRADLMAKVRAHGDGHGVPSGERATYTFDADGTPLRFVVVDTANETGGAEGVLRRDDVVPLLDRAKADGKWVILASHHAASSLGEDTRAWIDLLAKYPNVVFSLVGHAHRHRVLAIGSFWEVMTSAIADYPHELRLLELFDQDDGWLMLRATCIDLAVDGDRVADEGRRRGVVDYVSGWLPANPSQRGDRNVELWIPKPR